MTDTTGSRSIDATVPVGGASELDNDLITLAGLLFEAESALEQRVAATLRARVGIAPEAFEALLRLSRSPQGRLRMSELSRRMSITNGGTTRLMERLERDDLVQRTPSTTDRRVVYAVVTDKGRSELDRAIGPHLEDLVEIFTQRLSPADVADLERGLRALRDALIDGD
ncbi:MarR family winged helix-turn-helix transcriptional regulator [Microlunatus soli]|uniref:DNA-binding transcriptional regulator, MarR family n=1 Tax=Microlunatus soli TaxID=630515 RepID=A0A1H1MWW9_9ACTN|nr:MarR family transcriptional regulator [Microlunatus soli]SDR91118.1 DNA-binding transcriptional regulator, MarR family [Microlunatus soli]